VAGPHGLRGALRLRPDNPDSGTLGLVSRLFIETAEGCRSYQIAASVRLSRGHWRVTLAGLDSRDRADRLTGGVVKVAASDLPPLGPGEFYYFQALGCEVYPSGGGPRLGTIEEIFPTKAHDVWVVREGGSEVFIPVTDQVVRHMDFATKRVTVELPKGMLD